MIHRIANNQSLVSTALATSLTYTDPIAVGEDFNGCGSLVVHYLQAPGANEAKLSIWIERSNDAVYWKADAAADIDAVAATSGAETFEIALGCAYYRARYEFNPGNTGTDLGAASVVFDLVMRTYQS